MRDMLEPDRLAPILLGGIGGAVVAFVLQTWRDHLAARRQTASAAIVMRMELVQNGSIVINVVQGVRLPRPSATIQLEKARFDRLIPEVAASLNDEALLELLYVDGYHGIANAYVQDAVAGRSLDADEVRWLENEWLPLNRRCQLILRLAASPWYVKLWRWREARDLGAAIDDHIRRSTSAPPASTQGA